MAQPPVTIYIVDDDESVRRSLSRLMKSAGYAAVTFAGADELLAEGTLREPACVIADVRMHGGSGLDIPGRLREGGLSLPVIIVTAQDTEEVRVAARQAGVAACFRKPVDDQALIDAIEWVLGAKPKS